MPTSPTDSTPADRAPPSALQGWIAGIITTLIWAGYQLMTRQGLVGGGYSPAELTLFRFLIPGCVLLPLLSRSLPAGGRNDWPKALWLSLLSGPVFGYLTALGFAHAPVIHGAIFYPSFTMLFGVGLSLAVLGNRLHPRQQLGLLLAVAGVGAAGLEGLGTPRLYIGDLYFVLGAALWAAYGTLLARWKLGGLAGAALASGPSAIVAVIAFACIGSPSQLLAHPPLDLLTQIVFQGLFAGVIAVVSFGHAVRSLGAMRAALFPAAVPALVLLLNVLLFGIAISPTQQVAVVLTTLGLLLAANASLRLTRRAR